jgi:hypothetical protein
MDASCHHKQTTTRAAEAIERVGDCLIEHVIVREYAVVIASEDGMLHP